jgi:hypothetical protein
VHLMWIASGDKLSSRGRRVSMRGSSPLPDTKKLKNEDSRSGCGF